MIRGHEYQEHKFLTCVAYVGVYNFPCSVHIGGEHKAHVVQLNLVKRSNF